MTMADIYFPVLLDVHLIVLSVIVVFCFFKFPSLRKYRKKSNLAIYALVALMLGFLAYESYDLHLGPAVVSYMADDEQQFYAGAVNQFIVSCKSSGLRPISFYLVVKSENASLLANDQQGYVQVNSTEIRIPFNLPSKNAEDSKPVQFTIDENATGFALHPNIEPQTGRFIDVISGFQAYGVWNSISNSYTLNVDVECLIAP